MSMQRTIHMQIHAKQSSTESFLPLRTRYRKKSNFQIVHDSIHRQEGRTLSYLLELGELSAGFGSVAIGGPWKDKPTILEFYVAPEHRSRAFELLEAARRTSPLARPSSGPVCALRAHSERDHRCTPMPMRTEINFHAAAPILRVHSLEVSLDYYVRVHGAAMDHPQGAGNGQSIGIGVESYRTLKPSNAANLEAFGSKVQNVSHSRIKADAT